MRRTWTTAATIAALTAATAVGAAASYAGQDTETRQDRVRTVQQVERPVTVRDARPPTATPTPSPTPTEEPAPEPTAPAPGPRLLGPGDDAPEVRDLQARLRQIDWFSGDVTDHYGDQTEAAVRGFQEKRGFPVTGYVDRRTLDRLHEMTTTPTEAELANVTPDAADGAPLDPRCTTGRVICVDKSSSSLRWVVDGEVLLTLDARFGGNGYVTREGSFSVYRMSRDHVSNLYDTSMPYAMFFSGGQAVHYSPDFAAVGYAGASHGCVNTRDYEGVAWLFDQVRLGDRVVVYWS